MLQWWCRKIKTTHNVLVAVAIAVLLLAVVASSSSLQQKALLSEKEVISTIKSILEENPSTTEKETVAFLKLMGYDDDMVQSIGAKLQQAQSQAQNHPKKHSPQHIVKECIKRVSKIYKRHQNIPDKSLEDIIKAFVHFNERLFHGCKTGVSKAISKGGEPIKLNPQEGQVKDVKEEEKQVPKATNKIENVNVPALGASVMNKLKSWLTTMVKKFAVGYMSSHVDDFRGEDGRPGKRGVAGPKGETGDKGIDGVAGKNGRDGAKGEKGDKGDKGDKGEAGMGLTRKDFKLGESYSKGNYVFIKVGSYDVMYVCDHDIKKANKKPSKDPKHWIPFKAPPGPQGVPGREGAAGKDGKDGPQGPKGMRGERGEKGEDGADGQKGARGRPGPAGKDGIDGAQGQRGKTGKPGQAGEEGPEGPQGTAGTGLRLKTFKIGRKYKAGDYVFAINSGGDHDGDSMFVAKRKRFTAKKQPSEDKKNWVEFTAPQGEPGQRGAKGDKGDPGDSGARGLRGPRGEAGLRGDKGEDGKRGAKGDKGDAGVEGEKGVDGKDGERGDPGPKGEDGLGLKRRDFNLGEKYSKGNYVFYKPKGMRYTSMYIADAKIESAKVTPDQDRRKWIEFKAPKGPRGEQGQEGREGPKGRDGSKGDKGDPGDRGDEGAPGKDGPPGPKGATGVGVKDVDDEEDEGSPEEEGGEDDQEVFDETDEESKKVCGQPLGQPLKKLKAVKYSNVHAHLKAGEDGAITRIKSQGWNAIATVSKKDAITKKSKARGVEFIIESKKYLMYGLKKGKVVSQHYNQIDYAIHTHINGNVIIYEKGSYKGVMGKYEDGDKGSVVVNSDQFVEYRLNDRIIYTSKQRAGFPLYTVAALYSSHSGVSEANYIEGPAKREAKAGCFIQMHNLNRISEMEDPGYIERKTFQGNGWNGGATSSARFKWKATKKKKGVWQKIGRLPKGVRGIACRPLKNNQYDEFGLSSSPRKQVRDKGVHPNTIDFAAYVALKTFRVVENGNSVGTFGNVKPDDRVAVVVNPQGYVEYRVNHEVRYTSAHRPAKWLHADISMYHGGSIEHDCRWVKYGHKQIKAKLGAYVEFTKFNKLGSPHPGVLKRLSHTGNAWNGEANSLEFPIKKKSKIRGIEWTVVTNTGKYWVVGLADPTAANKDKGYNNIPFGIYGHSNGYYYIYENGKNIAGHFGKMAPESVFSIYLNKFNEIEYSLNGKAFYTSKKKPNLPLGVDTSFYTMLTMLKDFKWTGGVTKEKMEKIVPGKLVEMTAFKKVIAGESKGEYEKNQDSGETWDAHMHSKGAFKEKDEVQGFSFRPRQTNKYINIGLNVKQQNQKSSWNDISFAIYLYANGYVYASEAGKNVMRYGKYNTNDVMTLSVNGDLRIEYRINGNLFYVSRKQVAYPMYLDAQFYTKGSRIKDLKWIKRFKTRPLTVGKPIEWTNNMYVGEYEAGTMQKVDGGTAWNGGVWSLDGFNLKQEKIRGVSFTPLQNNKRAMIGLTGQAKDPSVGYNTIDFAAYTNTNGLIDWYEKGSRIGCFGKYEPGTPIEVVVNRQNKPELIVGDEIRYTSKHIVGRDVHVDASVYEQSFRANDIKWVGYDRKQDKAEVGKYVQFTLFQGAVSQSPGELNYLESTSTGGWATGAHSIHSFKKEEKIKGISFKCVGSGGMNVMIGLSSGKDSSTHYNDIDYAIYCSGSSNINIYEKGAVRGGGKTTFKQGKDVLSVRTDGSTVYYEKNGNTFYTSTVAPNFPLSIDTSFYARSDRLKEIKWIGSKKTFR